MSSENSEVDPPKNSPRLSIYDVYVRNITDGTQRRGQAWMNALAEMDPELYESITGTEADCFYNDHNIERFREAVLRKE